MNLRRLWCRPRRQRTALIGHVCRRQDCRGRSPQDQLESITLPDTTIQPLGPAARDASDRVNAFFGALSVARRRVSAIFLLTRVPPQDFYSRADRERIHKPPQTLLKGVSPSPLPIRY